MRASFQFLLNGNSTRYDSYCPNVVNDLLAELVDRQFWEAMGVDDDLSGKSHGGSKKEFKAAGAYILYEVPEGRRVILQRSWSHPRGK